MKTIQLEVHEAKINHGVVDVAYTFDDCDIQMQISKKELIGYICENELNVFCTDVILGDCAERSAEAYLEDNLFDVVEAYLTEKLCAKLTYSQLVSMRESSLWACETWLPISKAECLRYYRIMNRIEVAMLNYKETPSRCSAA